MSKKISNASRSIGGILIHSIVIAGMMFTPYTHTLVSAQATETTETIQPAELVTEEQIEEIAIEPDTLIDTGTAAAVSESYSVENITDVATDEDENLESADTDEEEMIVTEPDPTTSNTEIPDVTDQYEPSAEVTETDKITPLSASSTETTTDEEPLPVVETAPEPPATSTTDTIINIENQAIASTTATTSAESGDNDASGPGTTAVVTGDAYAYSNIVNLTNTNIVNSTGFIMFLNQLFGMNGADVRDLFDVFEGGTTTPSCTTAGCETRQLEYYIENQSQLENIVTVSANSGQNNASGTTAAVVTGDAYAAANITNVVNTNIIDANYMMLTFSNFGDLLGDIVLPGKHLLEKLFQTMSGGSAPQNINTANEATIENTVSTNANTGDNSANSTSSTITTGDATTYNNVYNQVNKNVVNDDSFTMLFRVAGDWDGEIYGLPEGLSWERTDAGIAITNTPLNLGSTAVSTPALSIDIDNTAEIKNTVSVSASTGGNTITSSDEGYIATGDAYAAANVTNVANTNILGRNWSLLIFDIFGNWNGNISFGKPDLWIGGTANAVNGTTGAGREVLYTFTISNLGDAMASNVTLNGAFNSDLMISVEPMEDVVLGSIAPGETVEKTFAAIVTENLGNGSFPIDLTAELTNNEPDENIENNTEIVTVIAENIQRRGSGNRSGFTANDIRPRADLSITKTADVSSITPGNTVSYKVSVTNSGGPVYGAILYDTLFDANGNIITTQQWDLETIDTEETIVVTYDTTYATSSPNGTYINRAQVLGYHRNRIPRYMEPYDSMVATVPLNVTDGEPIVLGIATSTQNCDPYITSFITKEKTAPANQVYRLQTFINNFTPQVVTINEVFDKTTEDAVRDFQQKYAAEILDPWGLTEPTGNVYLTTKKKINDLYCEGMRTFPLTSSELAEINRFKSTTVYRHAITRQFETPKVPAEEEIPIQLTRESSIASPEPVSILDNNSDTDLESVTVETERGQKSLYTRITGLVKNIRLPNFKFWNYLFASENTND